MEMRETSESKPELRHKIIEVEGVKTHLVEAGEGKPLVLVDGWYSTWKAFADLIPYVSQHSKVIAIDLWGFGQSEELPGRNTVQNYAVHLKRLLENLDVGKTSMAGLSLGGSVSLEFASENPDMVDKLVVQGAPFYGRELLLGVRPPRELTEKFWATFVEPIVSNPTRILPYLRINPEKRRVSGENLRQIAKIVTESSSRAAAESLQSIFELDLRDKLKELSVPTLIVEGSHTFWPPLSTGKKLHQLIPDSKLVVIPGGAHELPTQRPDEFAKVVRRFLKG